MFSFSFSCMFSWAVAVWPVSKFVPDQMDIPPQEQHWTLGTWSMILYSYLLLSFFMIKNLGFFSSLVQQYIAHSRTSKLQNCWIGVGPSRIQIQGHDSWVASRAICCVDNSPVMMDPSSVVTIWYHFVHLLMYPSSTNQPHYYKIPYNFFMSYQGRNTAPPARMEKKTCCP